MGLKRREFLASSLALMASGQALSLLSPRSVLAQAAASGAAPSNRRLVLVQLVGGNDGLNFLIPYKNPAYAKARPVLAVPPSQILPLDGTDMGFHPALASLRDLYHAGRLAVIQGVGYPNPNRSHFESSDIWESGDPALENRTNGWAGRLLDQIHDQQGGLGGGIAVDDLLPLSMTSLRAQVQTVQDLSKMGVQFRDRYESEKPNVMAAYQKMYASSPTEADEARNARTLGKEALAGATDILEAVQSYQPSVTYPDSPIALQLQSISKLITGRSPSQVYHTQHGGYDHHSDQLTKHGPLLKDLSDALSAFYLDLKGHYLEEAVTVIVYSEFGRRVQENGSQGTDHGIAGLTLILGGAVKGGLYGNYPSLTDLEEGDLKYNVDYRSIYATLIHNWMGNDPEAVLGGRFPMLDFMEGSTRRFGSGRGISHRKLELTR